MEVENNPIVSVIMPTYNRPDMLKEALKSVFSQTYRDFEVIVVNDGGVDVMETIDPLNNEGKIIYLHHKDNMGRSAARNTGLKAARGKYIAYLDDDDIYYPNHLEILVGFLENSDYNVAYTDSYQTFLAWSTDKYVTTGKQLTFSNDFDRQELLINNFIPLLNVTHKKDVLDEVRLFDEDLNTHEDWDLLIRLSQKYDFHHIREITAEYRVRNDRTNSTTSKRASFLRTLKLIHSRYSHLVTDTSIIENQKQVEESHVREVEMQIIESSIMHYENLHRYRFTREFVKGKKVLDLACGEGYGSFILSEDANSVTGIDTDAEDIRYASSTYIKENLKFIKGSINDIPIEEEKTFDVIVCFNVLEHADDHDKLMNKIKRLVKDDGIFIVSTANKSICVDMPDYKNPLYSKELYFDEFKALLEKNFKNTHIYGQRVYPSSNIFPLFDGSGSAKDFVIERGDKNFLFVPPSKKEARFLVAISSDSPIKDLTGNSYLVDISETFFKYKDNLETAIGDLQTAMKNKDTYIGDLETAMKNKDTYIGDLQTTLNNIYNSHGWKALSFCYKVRKKLYPLNGIRRHSAKSAVNFSKKPKKTLEKLDKSSPAFLIISGIGGAPYIYRCLNLKEQLYYLGYHQVTCKDENEVIPSTDALEYKIIILNRPCNSQNINELINLCKKNGNTLVYSTDDLVTDHAVEAYLRLDKCMSISELAQFHQGVDYSIDIIKSCDNIIVSTDYLRSQLIGFNKKVYVLENALNEKLLKKAERLRPEFVEKKRNRNEIILGYFSGWANDHDYDFAIIEDVLFNVVSKYKNVKLRIVGYLEIDERFDSFGEKVEKVDFVPFEVLPKFIADVDINLVPLESNPHKRSKSAVKYLEAALLNVPTIASNLEPYNGIIKHLEDGLLCSNSEDWSKNLQLLIEDADMRYKIGDNACNKVKSEHTTIVRSAKLRDIIKDIITNRMAQKT